MQNIELAGISDAQATAYLRNRRLETGTDGSAKRLAEIEKAAITFQTKVIEEKNQIIDSGNYSDSFVARQMTKLSHDWIVEKTKLEAILVNIEGSLREVPQQLPERTNEHREISANFKMLSGDRRLEAIGRAITGADPSLAEALATEPPSTTTLADESRNMIIKSLQPEAHAEDQQRITDLRSRATATRATLNQVTLAIIGATK